MSQYRRISVYISVIIVISVGCYEIVRYISNIFSQQVDSLTLSGNVCDPATPKNTEDMGQFKFPPSMSNLKSSCFGIQGWSGNVQFKMLPSDLQYLIRNSQIRMPLTGVGAPVNSNLATAASTLKSYLYGSYHAVQPSGKEFSQDILIDTENATRYEVIIDFSGG